VEYSHPNDAKRSFRKLAYRRFKNVPLYLEWAPLASKRIDNGSEETNDENIIQIENSEDANRETSDLVEGPTPTIYVKNLNFHTTEDQLRQVFSKHAKDVRTVRIPKKIAPVKRSGGKFGTENETTREMSMGFGFVEFGSNESARTVLNKLQGFTVDGHILELKPSSKSGNQGVSSTAAKNTTSKSTKLMVRNVPFQATRKELLQLFGSFGPLKKVRLPKKFDGSHRGFAFVEYMAAKEAAAAMHTLSATHLYGRHLVLEWAAADEETENLDVLRAKAKRNIGLDALSARMENKRIRFE
jgi:multiple RNA-binding domain-containing protein 1